MKQTGTVISTDGTSAKIAVVRESACGGNCASCGGCKADTVVEALNLAGAKKGDRVVLEMDSSRVLLTAFTVYTLPIILLIAVYFAAAALFHSETAGIAAGSGCMVLAYAAIIAFSKKNKNKYTLKVEKIL